MLNVLYDDCPSIQYRECYMHLVGQGTLVHVAHVKRNPSKMQVSIMYLSILQRNVCVRLLGFSRRQWTMLHQSIAFDMMG